MKTYIVVCIFIWHIAVWCFHIRCTEYARKNKVAVKLKSLNEFYIECLRLLPMFFIPVLNLVTAYRMLTTDFDKHFNEME